MASKLEVAKLFVHVTLNDTVTKKTLKEAIVNDTTKGLKDKIFLCDDGSIICGHGATSVDKVVEYGFNKNAEERVSALEKLLKDLGTDEGAVKAYIDAAKAEVVEKIEGLDLAEVGGVGSFIQSISQEDGKVVATASDLNAAAVATTAIAAGDDTVAVAGTTVEAQVADLAKSIYTVDKAAAKYSLKRVDSNDKNVRDAYQLMETIGDGEAHVVKGADTINVYKDSSLKEVKLVTEGKVTVDGVETTKTGQFLEFTYILEDGTESTVDLDVSTFLVESEFGEGLQVNDGVVSLQISTANSGGRFVTLAINDTTYGSAGLTAEPLYNLIETGNSEIDYRYYPKIRSMNDVTSAIYAMLNSGSLVRLGNNTYNPDTHKTIPAYTDKFLSIDLPYVDLSTYLPSNAYEYVICTKDIASAAAVGLNEDGTHVATTGNYTSAATTIAGEIAALDAQVKVNSDAIDVLNGTEDGSVAKAVADAKDALVDNASDDYNTLGKLEAKVKAGSTVVSAKDSGHVTVTVDTTAADGHAVVTVAESDIASADALQKEVDRATEKESELLDIITKMYNGQTDTKVTVDTIEDNLAAIIAKLNDASSYWEEYDNL